MALIATRQLSIKPILTRPMWGLSAKERAAYDAVGMPVFRWQPYEFGNASASLNGPVTVTGSPTLDASGYNFADATKYATHASASLINATKGTVYLEYVPNWSNPSPDTVEFDCRSAASAGFSFAINVSNQLSTVFGGSAIASVALTWVAGTKYKLALTYDGTNVTLYRNATQVAQAAQPAMGTVNANLFFGKYALGAVSAAGKIGRVLIWNKALTAAQLGVL